MKYRKKPLTVEAEQFWPDERPWPAGVEASDDTDIRSTTGYLIGTLEGRHEVTPGDFIITGVAGERYPCKPRIFEATYEPVDGAVAEDGPPGAAVVDHPRCGNCDCFEPAGASLYGPPPEHGECRRHGPTFCYEAEQNGNPYGYWPMVRAGDWCGEHTDLREWIEQPKGDEHA